MKTNSLEKKIGYRFKNSELLLSALTHRSYLNENQDSKEEHNERLEFLGDAVLEFLVTFYLYQEYPDSPEGELTGYRAAVVSAKSLGEAARSIELGNYLRLAKGEENSGGRDRLSILADSFEALLGAVFVDGGWEQAEKVLVRTVFPKIPAIIAQGSYKDPKSLLQEKVQGRIKLSPRYETVAESGPDHRKIFTISVYADQQLLASGQGRSKQEAEEEAARNALRKYDNLRRSSRF